MKKILTLLVLCFTYGLGFSQPSNAVEIYLLNREVNALQASDTPNGQFFISSKDLQTTPLITDDEIISYNLRDYTLKLDKSALQKLNSLQPTAEKGIQFALTVNKKPILTGYLFNSNIGGKSSAYVLLVNGGEKQIIKKGFPEENTHSKEQRNNLLLVNAINASNRNK